MLHLWELQREAGFASFFMNAVHVVCLCSLFGSKFSVCNFFNLKLVGKIINIDSSFPQDRLHRMWNVCVCVNDCPTTIWNFGNNFPKPGKLKICIHYNVMGSGGHCKLYS